MFRWLKNEVRRGELDILHSHGMWQMNAVYPGWVAARGRCPLVTSPRGAFSPWAMASGSAGKRIFWSLLQQPALSNSHCFHVTSEEEYGDVRRLGFRQPVAIIPNGIDLPPLEFAKKPSEGKTLLFLGRIHKVKGIAMLLQAWRSVQSAFPDWRLKIVGDDSGYGPSTGHLAEMKVLAAQLGVLRVEFAGQLSGDAKWQAYSNADLFVLPSLSENFGIAVAEALASGLPALVTRGAPWGGLTQQRAGWWVDTSPSGIREALTHAFALSAQELTEMGVRGRQWMENEFAWAEIGRRVEVTYQWLIELGANKPEWVFVD